MTFRWYVAQTKPNAERAAQRRLNRQRFATHLAMRTTRTAVRGVIVEHLSPLFPGYLFVLLDVAAADEHWKHVNSTRAVMTLLPTSERPIAIRHSSDIESLHEAERDGILVSGIVLPGATVRVYRGALVSQVLEVIDCVDDCVRALWDCMGAKRVVSVPLDDVTVLR